jgi:hypothetical protein
MAFLFLNNDITVTAGLAVLSLLFFTTRSKQKTGVNVDCAALKLPTDSSNELRTLAQLPRMVRKARLSARLKQLNRTVAN